MSTVRFSYRPHPQTNKLRYIRRDQDGEVSYGVCDFTGSFNAIPPRGLVAKDLETGLDCSVTRDAAIEAFKE